MKIKVLHLTPHIGGGVGSVIVDWLNSLRDSADFDHSLVCLDFCTRTSTSNLDPDKYTFADGLYFKSRDILFNLIDSSDIVLLHYWNHPLLSRLLVEEGLPKSRIICWCHNSGLYEPSIIPSYLVPFVDKLVFTSEASLYADNLQNSLSLSKDKFSTIHSARDFREYLNLYAKRSHNQSALSLLYVGTVSYDKLNDDFITLIRLLVADGFNITVVGGPKHDEFRDKYFPDNQLVNFTGPVKSQLVLKYLAEADIFIYPLRSDHYGTGEQCLLEAMATGLPVVAFSNPAESLIISHDGNGYLESNTLDYFNRVKKLSFSIQDRKRVSHSAYSYIHANFGSESINYQFESIFHSVINLPNRPHHINHSCNSISPILQSLILNSFKDCRFIADLFSQNDDWQVISKLSNYINCEIQNRRILWTSLSKGSPAHYLSYFPDPLLKQLDSLIINPES